MKILFFLSLMLCGWVISVVVGMILGVIFRSNNSKIGGYIVGLLIPFITTLIVARFLLDKNINNTYDFLSILFTLLPIIFINILAIYNSGRQDATGNNTYGSTGIEMKVNKGLVFGTLTGVVIAFYLLTQQKII